MKSKIFIVSLVATLALASCARQAKVETLPFGTTAEGEDVTLYRLTNPSGASMEVIDYGCRVVAITVPDRDGVLDDVVVGYDNLKDFETGRERFFGALLGRYANRIEGARFTLDGTEYAVTPNEKFPDGLSGHLHGGSKGFDRHVWKGEPFVEGTTAGVRFSRLSPDGEEGYPANLQCEVTYLWTADNVWRVEYRAECDAPTVVCMSNHCYFNLKGTAGGTVLDNILTVAADSVTPNNIHYVPRGAAETVEGSPLDFRTPHTFLERIDRPNDHMRLMGGYSANWILNDRSEELHFAARLECPSTGRIVETWTTEPAILIYTGRGLSDKITGKGSRPLSQWGGLILETIHSPNTPNRPDFPSAVLRPDEHYYSQTEYRFTTIK